MKIYVIVAVMILMAASGVYSSFSFGTLQIEKEVKMSAGQTANFRILLVNRGSEPLSIEFTSLEQPEGFGISFSENRFLLQAYGNDTGDVFHWDGSRYLRMHPVDVRVSAPLFTNLGEYRIKIKAKAAQRDQSTLSLEQERDFDFRVMVVKPELPAGKSFMDQLAEFFSSPITGLVSAFPAASKAISIPLLLVLITLVAVYIILRRYR